MNRTKSRNILVVGGAGYIGSHMVRRLLEEGYNPMIFDNLSTGHKEFIPKGAAFIKGDLRNYKDIMGLFKKIEVDAVMHFAASALVGESMQDPIKYYENNTLAFINLLKTMIDNGVSKLIFSSTCAIFGEPKCLPIEEDDEKKPTNPYGQSKLMIERILEDAARVYKFSYISLRYFNAAGAHFEGEVGEWHEPETHLIPNILKMSAGKKKILTVFGDDYPTPDGTCVRDYIHVEDLCEAHLLALKSLRGGTNNTIFNLGCGNGYSVKEVIEAVERITGRKIKTKICSRRPGDPARLIASSVKAKRILGWTPKHGLEEIISSAWEWERGRL